MVKEAGYKPLDMKTWARTPYYNYYAHGSKGMCAMTADIDISALAKKVGQDKIYVPMLYAITTVINAHKEFRVGYCKENGELMIWDYVSTIHRVFHPDTETFTRVCTEWNESYKEFAKGAEADIKSGEKCATLNADEFPESVFEVSYVPWVKYSSVNMKMSESGKYLAPIVTFGKAEDTDGKTKLPLTMQISHAVADGFHIARFFEEVKQEAEKLAAQL